MWPWRASGMIMIVIKTFLHHEVQGTSNSRSDKKVQGLYSTILYSIQLGMGMINSMLCSEPSSMMHKPLLTCKLQDLPSSLSGVADFFILCATLGSKKNQQIRNLPDRRLGVMRPARVALCACLYSSDTFSDWNRCLPTKMKI
jgi:hypothetical protein